jgi:molybdopterin molybdotransferase
LLRWEMTEAGVKARDLELEAAVAAILAAVPAPVLESVPIAEAHGRVVAEAIRSLSDLPRFDNSSMDGYAVRAKEVSSAKPDAPSRLRLAGQAAAGAVFQGELAARCCVRVSTGAALPAGTDAVVMQEDTRAESGEEILVFEAVKPWENVRLGGEDVKSGEILANAGEVLSSGQIGLLAAAGVAKAGMGRRPQVGLVAAGSELREPGEPIAPGQIYESNRLALAPLIRACGGVPKLLPLVIDALEPTRLALENAFTSGDVVVTTGGASVGEFDFLKAAFLAAGGELQFWQVAIKPGRPFFFGRRGAKLLFGLPGNPVSAFVTFLLLVRPALLRWQGAREVSLPTHPGVLAEPLENAGRRRHFIRVRVDAVGRVFSAGLQASHALGSLGLANGLVEVPPGASIPANATVQVLRWE